MQINSDAEAQLQQTASDAVGPLNALEADRYVEELRTFTFEEFGGSRWMTQHEMLEKLNVQTHVNASQQRDEFVMEALVLHEKIPLLIRELVSTELWKENVFPLVHEFLSTENSIKGYMLLYHEAVLINLLESVLYHKQACEAAGDMIVELTDYCHRKLVWLLSAPPPERSADPEELKAQLMAEGQEEYLTKQVEAIRRSCALYCLSIVRFLTDHMAELPLAVTARLLETYDVLMVLAPLLEAKPWQSESGGKLRRFVQGQWSPVGEAEARRMHKAEA